MGEGWGAPGDFPESTSGAQAGGSGNSRQHCGTLALCQVLHPASHAEQLTALHRTPGCRSRCCPHLIGEKTQTRPCFNHTTKKWAALGPGPVPCASGPQPLWVCVRQTSAGRSSQRGFTIAGSPEENGGGVQWERLGRGSSAAGDVGVLPATWPRAVGWDFSAGRQRPRWRASLSSRLQPAVTGCTAAPAVPESVPTLPPGCSDTWRALQRRDQVTPGTGEKAREALEGRLAVESENGEGQARRASKDWRYGESFS